jgi:hypothetical protein
MSDHQEETDWKVFASVFKEREGVEPHPRDSRAKELFLWFTIGAHCEHIGRLNVRNEPPKS